MPPDPASSRPVLPTWARWLLLALACILANRLLDAVHMPAGGFIGPMAVAITYGVTIGGLKLPRVCFKLSQGTIGVLIAQTLTMSVLLEILDTWPVMLLATAITLLLSLIVGIGLVRYGGLPGTTAAWGTTPGAAAAMVAMAEESDADPRIVAAMQYVRVVCVVLVGALVSHYLGVTDSGESHHAVGLPHTLGEGGQLMATLGIIVAGVWLFDRRLPAGALLGPVVLGTVLHLTGVVEIRLPQPLLELAYGIIGTYVGLRFDRETVHNIARALSKMILASLLLIAMCAVSGWLITLLIHTRFITAYLGTSPGGLDSMTIIAIDTHADVGLVVALQTMRLFTVILVGPGMARLVARFARPASAS
ncbi:AbrB family transcriptional regulator [Salinicola rhizosphaerae]|uniref:Membrane protein n=1 Tax=Salinicola rhizosphaerae TaxID=1443141 RepID=A0ABQ3DYQ5_9GAMM|nr:AbrB family transcriptional regulator [Salinicola rhizosphaerae]GHB17767.1 membrane protein [Salinicola rhizosphaerae]